MRSGVCLSVIGLGNQHGEASGVVALRGPSGGKGGVGLVPRGVGEGVGAAAVADGVEEGRFPGVAVGIPAVGGFGADASGEVADVFVAVVAADVDGTLVRAALGGGGGRRCAVGSLCGGA